MLIQLLLAAVPLLVYLLTEVRHRRYFKYPGLPHAKTSFVWGHMKLLHEYMQKLQPGEHADVALGRMVKDEGYPPVMLVDVWPSQHFPIVLINSHDVAEQVSKVSKKFPWSVPKSPTIHDLEELLGPHSILMKQDEDWKTLRRRLNPGFAPQYLTTFIPQIMDKTNRFLAHLDNFSRTGEEFLFEPLCTNLTFDIIGAVTMGVDFKAQTLQRNEVSNKFAEIGQMSEKRNQMAMFMPKYFLNRRIVKAGKELDVVVKQMVREKFDETMQETDNKKSRSVLALSLQGATVLDEQLLAETADSLKTFLFAGHDTTSILLQWVFYELSRSPRAQKALRAELDQVFGEDCSTEHMRDQLLNHGEELLQKLQYTSAIIKEALRLYPPAGSARLSPEGTGCMVKDADGREYCLDGLIIYIIHYVIQRDPAVYGPDAEQFVPERWLGNTDTSESNGAATNGSANGTAVKLPASAWRPFERGPRNCIGQELANLEARIIIALVARRYDFTKIGLGELELDGKGQPILEETGQYRVKSELYNTRAVTSKPVDGTRMRIALTPQVKKYEK